MYKVQKTKSVDIMSPVLVYTYLEVTLLQHITLSTASVLTVSYCRATKLRHDYVILASCNEPLSPNLTPKILF